MEHIVAVIDEGMIFDFPRLNLMDLDDISRTLEFISHIFAESFQTFSNLNIKMMMCFHEK